jgi:hypothetical protein
MLLLTGKIPLDKQAHFFSGYVLGISGALAASHSISPLLSAIFGLGGAVVAGIGKEIYAKQHPESHTADIYDLLATSLGGLFGTAFFLIFG